MNRDSSRVNCPACQGILQEGADICEHCGQELCPDCGQAIAENATACAACGLEFGLFCAECDQEVSAEATVCPHCGTSLEDDTDLDVDSGPEEKTERHDHEDQTSCPRCDASVFLRDGYCNQCGATICPVCSQEIDEDVESCPHCQTKLFFDCQNCGFELTIGADQCPNCNAVIPNFCTNCATALPLAAERCPSCDAAVIILPRTSSRIIHSLVVADQVIQVIACPNCGEKFQLHEGTCGHCGYRVCSKCQISLLPNEPFCPRCGPAGAQILAAHTAQGRCPRCLSPVETDSDQCTKCGQLLCPECQVAVGELDTSCSNCGAEFDFACPQCEAILPADAAVCSQCKLIF